MLFFVAVLCGCAGHYPETTFSRDEQIFIGNVIEPPPDTNAFDVYFIPSSGKPEFQGTTTNLNFSLPPGYSALMVIRADFGLPYTLRP